jgi:hypothetical protein
VVAAPDVRGSDRGRLIAGGNVTCSLTAEQAARLDDRIEVGDRVSIRCDADAKLVRIDRR